MCSVRVKLGSTSQTLPNLNTKTDFFHDYFVKCSLRCGSCTFIPIKIQGFRNRLLDPDFGKLTL